MRNRTGRACLVMLLGVLVLAGCGGGSSKPGAVGGGSGGNGSGSKAAAVEMPDPCALVTKQEVAAAVCDSITETKEIQQGYSNMCLFGANTFTSLRTSVFNDRTTLAQFDAYVRGRQKDGGAPEASPVAGLGDAARYLVAESGTEPELHVLKGGVYFVLGGFTSMYKPDGQPAWEGTAPPPAIRQLAMQALARLPGA